MCVCMCVCIVCELRVMVVVGSGVCVGVGVWGVVCAVVVGQHMSGQYGHFSKFPQKIVFLNPPFSVCFDSYRFFTLVQPLRMPC